MYLLGCTQGELRLQGGPTLNEGRLEICIDNIWGTVCDDLFQEPSARVACRQLGFSAIDTTILTFEYGNSNTLGPIWLDNVQCIGNETKLFDCPSNGVGVNDCDRREDVGLRCMSKEFQCVSLIQLFSCQAI